MGAPSPAGPKRNAVRGISTRLHSPCFRGTSVRALSFALSDQVIMERTVTSPTAFAEKRRQLPDPGSTLKAFQMSEPVGGISRAPDPLGPAPGSAFPLPNFPA